MNLVSVSISTSLLIIVVLVLRSLLIKKLPKRTFLVLWTLVVFRLLIPVKIPFSMSIYSWFRIGSDEYTFKEKALSDISVSKMNVNVFKNVSGFLYRETPVEDFLVYSMIVIWFIVFLLLGIFFIISYSRCICKFRCALPVSNRFILEWQENNLFFGRVVSISQSKAVMIPLSYGLFRPTIILPEVVDIEDTKLLKYILAHEGIHIKRLDIILKTLLVFILCIYWFNPLVWVVFFLCNRDIEFACDEAVIGMLGIEHRASYAKVLLEMECRKNIIRPFCTEFSNNAIEERIGSIMKMKKISISAILSAMFIVASVTVVFATTADTKNLMITTEDSVVYVELEENEPIKSKLETEYWSYDEFKNWLDKEKQFLYTLPGSEELYFENGKWVEWSKNDVEFLISKYENILNEIKNGAKVFKNNGEDGSGSMFMFPMDESKIEIMTSNAEVKK